MATKINQDFWLTETQSSFRDFFNKFCSKQNHWGVTSANKQATIVAVPEADNRLSIIFTPGNIKAVTGQNDISIFQFLIMTSIMLNETGGSFILATGEYGSAKYMFSYNPSIPKVSYNCAKSYNKTACSTLGNKSAYDLFHDPIFMNVPARASMYKPKNINDPLWQGYTYPTTEPEGNNKHDSGKSNYPILGIIGECDFYKFRGRGVIQLTGRGNYKKWLEYINANKTTIPFNSDSGSIINAWGSSSIEDIATKITNIELDKLFSDNALAILVFKTHSSNKALVEMYSVDSPDKFIDLAFAYGKSIGGTKYGTLFANRVFEIVENIPDWVSSSNLA